MTAKEIFKYTSMSEDYRIKNNIPIEEPETETFVLWITPEMAIDLMKRNIKNRKISPHLVDSYAQQIINNEWELNGESICLSVSGILKDGQHRLSAIIKTNIAVQCVVVFNVKDDVSIYDRGRKRSITDALLISGWDAEYANRIISAACGVYLETSAIKAERSRNKSEGDMKRFIEAHKNAIEFVNTLPAGHGAKLRQGAVVAAIIRAVEAGEDKERITKFFNIISEKSMPEGDGDSVAIMVKRMIDRKEVLSKRSRTDRARDEAFFESAIFDFCRKTSRQKAYKMSAIKQKYIQEAVQ